eukprot:9060965-Pyramimonas_sp.AAC.1
MPTPAPGPGGGAGDEQQGPLKSGQRRRTAAPPTPRACQPRRGEADGGGWGNCRPPLPTPADGW